MQSMIGINLYRKRSEVDTVFFAVYIYFQKTFTAIDKSRVITYEPDGTNSARHLHRGSRVSPISAFVFVCVRVSRSRYRTPIYRHFIDRVRSSKIYTGETALAPSRNDKSQSPQRRSKEQPIIRACHPHRIYEI